jgi:hypothetical protein
MKDLGALQQIYVRFGPDLDRLDALGERPQELMRSVKSIEDLVLRSSADLN